jgi:hypothetical protein
MAGENSSTEDEVSYDRIRARNIGGAGIRFNSNFLIFHYNDKTER